MVHVEHVFICEHYAHESSHHFISRHENKTETAAKNLTIHCVLPVKVEHGDAEKILDQVKGKNRQQQTELRPPD